MSSFLVLFKHELKMLFPILSFNKRKKHDIVGTLFSVLLTLMLAGVVIVLISKIAGGYVGVKVDKILDSKTRATELLNVLYLCVCVLMVIATIKKMKTTLTMSKYKQIYLRMPVSEQVLFTSKLTALLVWVITSMFMLILPINIIFAIVLDVSFMFWIKTLFVLLTMPIIVFGIAGILLVPAIKIIDYLKSKYLLLFIILSVVVGFAFIVYSRFLEIVKLWLETGSMRFLFNKNFVQNMQGILKWSYPSNCFANFMIGKNVWISLLLICLFITISVITSHVISNKLFHITIYKDTQNKSPKFKSKNYSQKKPLLALIKKEFICIAREPKYLFSYFAIAVTMPIMVYCCYTLFESLVDNAFGLKITFPLAMMVLLMFGILSNTFCVSNITREGTSFLKMKTVAVSPSLLLMAKVLFCSIISAVAILMSITIITVATNMSIIEGLVCLCVCVLFSTAQILIATKLDLNHAKFSNTTQEDEAVNSKNLTKVVLIGLAVALIMGVLSVVGYLFFKSGAYRIKIIDIYIYSIVISFLYFVCSLVYYKFKLRKKFNNMVG